MYNTVVKYIFYVNVSLDMCFFWSNHQVYLNNNASHVLTSSVTDIWTLGTNYKTQYDLFQLYLPNPGTL